MSKKNLVIVESPAKAKTIEKYLGKDFKVMSSVGHIRSIPKKTKKGEQVIDIDNGFKTIYEVDPEKKKVISELKKAAKDADTIWLATDEDREGEAIAWHLCEVLKLDPKTTKRIVFHEITKGAIEQAVKDPRTVDMSLVQAQQARQILDRIVGFELSPVVWQKVPGGKSAGRVQSPAVRLLVEREREIDNFKAESDYKVTAELKHGASELPAELDSRAKTKDKARQILEQIYSSELIVDSVETKPSVRNPAAPFTTSTLQQEANSRLGFGSKATMSAAQKLYQDGKITYMRTDSVNLSTQALAQATEFIKKKYGEDYHQFRTYKTKSSSAQEAHEAIRPTDISLEEAGSDPYQQKIYDLIRRRTLASQMSGAKLEKTTITVKSSATDKTLVAKGEVIIFDGFLAVYGKSNDESKTLPPLKDGDSLDFISGQAKQTFSRPPARYTEGSLVKKLEELGIGRPSTYATIINTIQTRGYAQKGESDGIERQSILLTVTPGQSVKEDVIDEMTLSDKGKLVPTASGQVLNDFLVDNFGNIVDYSFTSKVEDDFDSIAEGKLERNSMLSNFYGPFHELIDKSGDIKRSAVAKAREVGKHPKTGRPIFARFGRFGPMLQHGDSEDKDNKPDFAPLPKGEKIETITLESALKAFELPRLVGQTKDGQDINANIGRFGPYIKVGSLFVSIKPEDPHTISLDKSLELYDAKLKQEAEKNINEFAGGIKVLNGRFGPYITDGKKNAKIPKDQDPKKITEAEAKELLDKAPAKKRRTTYKKKS